MATHQKSCCDVCGRDVQPSELRTISDAYACAEIVDVCDGCWPWVCNAIAQEKAKLAENVTGRIKARRDELRSYRDVERVSMQQHQAKRDAEGKPGWRRFLYGFCDL